LSEALRQRLDGNEMTTYPDDGDAGQATAAYI
jgi:hypothetical protein